MAKKDFQNVKKLPLAWVLFALAGFFALTAVLLLVLLFTQRGGALRDKAFAEGQQARLILQTGAVEGNLAVIEKPKAETPEPTTQTPPEEAPNPQAEQINTEEPAPAEEPAEAPAEEPAQEPTAAAEEALPPPKVSVPLRGSLNPTLYETVEKLGKLPVVSDSKQESWKYYGQPDISAPGQPAIALIVTGVGLNRASTVKALALPEFVSLSFSPYAAQLQQQITRARTYGHEVWLDLPLQPMDFPASDNGPLSLYKDMADDKVVSTLHTLLSSSLTYVGFVGTANDAVSDFAPIHAAAKELKQRGLLLMLRTNRYGNPETQGHVVYVNRTLDALPEGAGADAAQILVELEATAKEYGYAIGVLGDAPHIFKEISQWSETLPAKGIALVPATAIVGRMKP